MSERSKSQIGRSSRSKGQAAERQLAAELSALLGVEVKRRVRNHAGENDLTGLPGWSPECKCWARPELAAWWAQAVAQAQEGDWPVLFYKLPRKPFRAVVPLAVFGLGETVSDLAYTADLSLEAFAAVYRENEAIALEAEQKLKTAMVMAGERIQ